MMFSRCTVLLALTACATLSTPALAPHAAPGADTVEAFYGARDPQALRAAQLAAARSHPDSALTHELTAQLAALDGDEDLAFEALMKAVADTSDDAALLHVHLLANQAWTKEHRLPAYRLMRALSAQHPDPEVRAAAAYTAAQQAGLLGDLDDR
ncbi:MAG: hypothetical protein JNK82_38380, partial [Myxococcaceae bacterium]|nr:hypothetical protein [Myxococcaceae bacterium]